MICSIVLRYPNNELSGKNKLPEIIYTHDNYYESLAEFENIALDCIANLGGELCRKMTKSVNECNVRGYYCVPSHNKFSIYVKEKNGWLYSGALKLLKEFEFISLKRKRDYKDLQDELNKRIDNIDKVIFGKLEEVKMNLPTIQNLDKMSVSN